MSIDKSKIDELISVAKQFDAKNIATWTDHDGVERVVISTGTGTHIFEKDKNGNWEEI